MHLSKPARYVLASQLSLYSYLLVCFLLLPKFLLSADEDGVSNYGVRAQTVVPYSIAFWLSGLLLLAAATLLKNRPKLRALKRSLYLLGMLTFLVVLTTYPYKVNGFFDHLHILAASALFLTEMAVGIWLILHNPKSILGWTAFTIQAVGFVLSILTLYHVLHILFLAQLINNVSFSILLVSGVSKVTD